MSAEHHDEVERKYEVDPDTRVPALHELSGVARVAPPIELKQVATYYDTHDLRLLAAGVTLRRRTGGLDDGWHLKLPAGGDRREELRVEGAHADAIPTQLLDRVRGLVRDAAVGPTAVLTTRRRLYRVLGENEVVLAEFCADHVTVGVRDGASDGAVVDAVGGAVRDAPEDDEWHEWELELVEASEELLDAAEPMLLGAGARPASTQSKLARAIGQPSRQAWRTRTELGKLPSAVELLTAYLSQYLARLQDQDLLLRSGDQGGVHQLRVAARRMRSALATYAPVLPPESTDELREELRWLGATLAEARDAQVLRKRLTALLEQEPSDMVLGPVKPRLDAELGRQFRRGRAKADEALAAPRYFRLLDRLEDFLAQPPLTEASQSPAEEVVPRLLKRDLKRLRKRQRGFESAETGEERDLTLHEIRKAAKRLRYAAETARPVFGKRAKRLAARAEAVQELLGEHQDSVMSRVALREIGARAFLSGENGFTFGRLHGVEQARATEIEEAYPTTLSRLPTGQLDRWLRK